MYRSIYRCFFYGALLVAGCFSTGCHPKRESEKHDLQELGHHLFFDRRLSFNNTKSCASCHDPGFAFSDGYRRSATATGDMTLRNAPSLINAGLLRFFDAADPSVTDLETQHRRPLYAVDPVEMGVTGNETTILAGLRSNPRYRELFPAAFPGEEDPFRMPNVIKAIAAYVSTLKSENSRYDRFLRGGRNVLSESEKKGMALFFSDRLGCGSCHIPPHFTPATRQGPMDSIYVNTGIAPLSDDDRGLEMHTGKTRDRGKFRIPSLRNVAVTAPYMHDGSVATLGEVIDLYSKGGREPDADPRVKGFSLGEQEKVQLIDFLYALTDSTVFENPRFRKPAE